MLKKRWEEWHDKGAVNETVADTDNSYDKERQMSKMKNVMTEIRIMISRIIGSKIEVNRRLDRLLKSVQIVRRRR